jgi:ABC-type enterochelin transport system permease subunit
VTASQLVSLLYQGCFYIAGNNLIYIIFPIGLGTSLVSIHCFLWEPTTPNEFSTIRNSEGFGMVFGLGFSSPSRSLSVTLFVVVLTQDNHVLLS